MLELNKVIGNLPKYLGFKQEGESDIDPMALLNKQVARVTDGAVPTSNYLLYQYYDEENGLFFNKDGSVGFWFEISPLVGSNEKLEKNLSLFLNNEIPENGYIQFLIVASHKIDPILDVWEKERVKGGKPMEMLTKYRKGFIRKCSLDFAASNEGRLARNYRTFVSYSANSSNSKKDLKNVLKFKQQLRNKLKTERFAPRECLPDDLIEIGRDILQMRYQTAPERGYGPADNLAEQICRPFEFATIKDDQIEHNASGLASKVFGVGALPESYSLTEMIKLLGSSTKSISARFVLSYTISNNLGAGGKSSLVGQGKREIHAAERSYTRHDTNVKSAASQWIKVINDHKKGDDFLSESLLVMITTYKDEIEVATSDLLSLWNAEDWQLKLCQKTQLLGALSMLPMTQSSYWHSLKWFRLTRFAQGSEVVGKLPLQGEWKGVPKSGVLLSGVRGQLFNWNPFHRVGGAGNYNFIMMAPSGAGKSFLLQDLVQSLVSQGVATFIIDIGASYQNICKLLGGELVRFNKANEMSLNPFAGLSKSGVLYAKAIELLRAGKDLEEVSRITKLQQEKLEALLVKSQDTKTMEEEAIEILELNGIDKDGNEVKRFVAKDAIIYAKCLLAKMCEVSGNRYEGIIERAIVEGVIKYGESLDITKFRDYLDNLKDKNGQPVEGAKALADSLYTYTEDGIHGRFFKNSDKQVTFKKNLTVIELEEIKDDMSLLPVVLQILAMQITNQFICGERMQPFALLIDEGWRVMNYAIDLLDSNARTFRKYFGALGICTQDLDSFLVGPKHLSLLANSSWKLIMQQGDNGIKSFENKAGGFAEHIELIKSVRKCPSNNFSEVLICTDNVKVIGRLAVDPYSRALYSTEPQDFAFLRQREQADMPFEEAVLELASKYGDLAELERYACF